MIGYWSIAGDFGLQLMEIEHGIDDKAVLKFTNEEKTHKVKIRAREKSGRQYVQIDGEKFYMDECIRVNE